MFRKAGLLVIALVLLTGVVRATEIAPPRPQVVGGDDVPDPNPYRYQAFVGLAGYAPSDSRGRLCSGSLLALRWVLAAAHCFTSAYSDQADELQVVVGVRSLSQASGANVYAVNQILRHPGYDPDGRALRGEQAIYVDDLALLELARPIDGAAAPIALLDAEQAAMIASPGTVATLTGWGGLKGYQPGDSPSGGQTFPDTLQMAALPLLSDQVCVDVYTFSGSSLVDASRQLCAGYLEGGVDSCQGDSGGPLVVPDRQGTMRQVGVVSFGNGCAAADYPGVYTRVAAYAGWINTIVFGQRYYFPLAGQ